jgi:hypothetical protein
VISYVGNCFGGSSWAIAEPIKDNKKNNTDKYLNTIIISAAPFNSIWISVGALIQVPRLLSAPDRLFATISRHDKKASLIVNRKDAVLTRFS